MATIHPTDIALPSDLPPLPDRKLSEEEFLAWCDEDTKAEWVDGQVIMMSPASFPHADMTMFLGAIIKTWTDRRKLGKVLGPEFPARLSPRVRRVPDLMFISKERVEHILLNHFEGAPDFVIEVVSPESVERDWRDKYADYQAAGVREYWIIDPAHRRVNAYQLADGAYQRLPQDQGRIASNVLTGFFLREQWLWGAEPPIVDDVLKELEGAVQGQEGQSPKSE